MTLLNCRLWYCLQSWWVRYRCSTWLISYLLSSSTAAPSHGVSLYIRKCRCTGEWPLSSSLRKKLQNKQKQIYRHKTNILVLCVAMGVCDGVSNWTFREFSPKFSATENIAFLCGDGFSDQLSSLAEISTGRFKCPKPLMPTNYNKQRDLVKCVCKKIQEESKWNTITFVCSREMFLFPVIIFSNYI